MSKKKFAMIDGALVEEHLAQISIFERGFLYGDGLFETCKIWQGKILNFKKHQERMERGLELLNFQSDSLDFLKLRNSIETLIAANQISEGLLRISVSRGLGGSGYLPAENSKALIVMNVMPNRKLPDKISIGIAGQSDDSQGGAKVIAMQRNLGIKSMNALPYILSKIEASRRQFFDLVILSEDCSGSNLQKDDPISNSHFLPFFDSANQLYSRTQLCKKVDLQYYYDGFICETSTSNIFWVKNGKIFTPADCLPIVHGCVRAALCDLHVKRPEFEICKTKAKISELVAADEIFLTNAANLVIGVDELVIEGSESKEGRSSIKFTKSVSEKIKAELMDLIAEC